MSSLGRRNRLRKELLALDEAMLLEELDGFIAGLLVCPELISPNEWLSIIWNQGEPDRQSPFIDVDHANFVFGLIMDHYNDVVLTLMDHAERYRPVLPAHRDEIVWEIWVEGFSEAVSLRPAAWQKLLDADSETSEAMLGMLTLVEVAAGNKDISEDLAGELTRCAPDLIPGWIVSLNKWRLANTKPQPVIAQSATPAPPPFASGRKVGRNEPCPCGSGKKYKRCCGLS